MVKVLSCFYSNGNSCRGTLGLKSVYKRCRGTSLKSALKAASGLGLKSVPMKAPRRATLKFISQ